MSDAGITLTEAPATPAHRHAALIACLAFAAVTALFAPFATAAWPNVPAFIPAYRKADGPGETEAFEPLLRLRLVADLLYSLTSKARGEPHDETYVEHLVRALELRR